MIVTFYSFKGGVGRSMAMVNIGEILADWGYRVILCDWDLEAPGLERYVVDGRKSGGPPAELAGWLARPGLVDLLQEYKETLAKPPALSEPEQTPPAVPPTHQQVGNVILRRPSTYAVATNPERRRQGSLSLLTAGRREGEHYQKYAEAVRAFDWNDFYESWAGDAYIEFLRLDLAGDPQRGRPGAADIVLIDSRTGVTEQGGVCTHHLADLVVLLSAANDLNLDGAIWMARTLADPRLVDVRGGRPLQILPTPSRIEQTAQKEELVTFRRRFRREFRRYVPAAVGRAEDFALRAEIPYMPFYSFTERVVAREPESQREQKLYAAYMALADGIVRTGVASGLLPEANAYGRVLRTTLPAYAESAERPKGLVQLGYAAADRAMAETVAQGMSAAGVQVWADFLLQQQPGTSRQDGALRTIDVCTGIVLLLGPGGIPPALRSEIDYALNRQARRPELRIVPVLLPGTDLQSLGPLADLYPIQLPPDLSPGSSEFNELFTSLAAEIGAPGADVPPAVDTGIPPYRGLRSFDESEARFFFGRSAEVQELMGRLGSARAGGVRWVQVEGPGGVGKSSFVLAGLVPAVRRGWIPGTGKSWIVATCRPGSDPIASLAAVFEKPEGVAASERQARLTASERGLCDLVRAATSGGECFLLVVDQLEELFFLDDLGKQAQLDALLAASLEDPDLPFYLVTTLRSDAFDQFQELTRLGALFRRGAVRHQLLPLSETALREAMTAPARLAGLSFESGLAERILRDLRLGPPSPALLELLLSRLWESRSGNLLTHEAYDRLGGIDGVLAESAERFFASLPNADQEQAQALLLQLVTAEGSRRSVRYDDAVGEIGEGPGTEEVLRKLAAAQIVTLTGDRVKLSHDALIAWPRFARWLAADRDALRRREELESAALAWTNAGEPPDGLPSGPQLAYFAPAPARSKPVVLFLKAARTREKRNKWIQRGLIAASLVTVGLLGAGLARWNRWNQGQQERSRRLTETALTGLRAQPTANLKFAIEAASFADNDFTKAALKAAIRSARARAVLTHGGKLNLAIFSPDDTKVLTAGAGGAILWQLDPTKRLSQFATTEVLTGAEFTSNHGLTTRSDNGWIRRWDFATGTLQEVPVGGGATKEASADDLRVSSLQLLSMREGKTSAVSANGSWTAFWDERGVVRFNLDGKQQTRMLAPDISRLIFSPSANRFAIVEGETRLVVGKLSPGLSEIPRVSLLIEKAGTVQVVVFSPDGDLLVTAQGDALSPTLWDLGTGAPRAVLRGHEDRVLSAVFSTDGSKLATTSADGTARVWDVATGKEAVILQGYRCAVTGAAFSSDGHWLVTAGADNTARVWDLREPDLRDDSVEALLKQANSRIPVTLGSDGKPAAAVPPEVP